MQELRWACTILGVFGLRSGPKKGMLSSCWKVRKALGFSERVTLSQCSAFLCPCNSAFLLSWSSLSPSGAAFLPHPPT